MRNHNQLHNDQGSSSYGFFVFMGGYALGAVFMGLLEYHTGYKQGTNDAPHGRILQLENQQMQHSLSNQFNPVNRIILNQENHTFSFDTTVQGTAEHCTGKYEAHNDLATAIGPIACTQSITVTSTK